MSDEVTKRRTLDLGAIRERLSASRGRDYWRSLEQLADTDEFREFLHNEFPALEPSRSGNINRREMLKVMGASLALAGFTACTSGPPEKIVPYVRAPEDFVPGKPLFYATAMPLSGYATGILVESHLGRPTKIEGNPQHPASLGATDAFAQASILTLYDPDRSQAVLQNGRTSSWAAARVALDNERGLQAVDNGAGLRILTETVSSPTLVAQIRALLALFPAARWHQYEPAGADSARAGSLLAFGAYVNPVYNVARADVILSLDADFLSCGPAHLRYAREWASRRRPGQGGMNRVYAVESTPVQHRRRRRPPAAAASGRSGKLRARGGARARPAGRRVIRFIRAGQLGGRRRERPEGAPRLESRGSRRVPGTGRARARARDQRRPRERRARQ